VTDSWPECQAKYARLRTAPMRERITMRTLAMALFTFDNKTELPRGAARALNVRFSGISSERVAETQQVPLRRE
jgi:hypothetical protein